MGTRVLRRRRACRLLFPLGACGGLCALAQNVGRTGGKEGDVVYLRQQAAAAEPLWDCTLARWTRAETCDRRMASRTPAPTGIGPASRLGPATSRTPRFAAFASAISAGGGGGRRRIWERERARREVGRGGALRTHARKGGRAQRQLVLAVRRGDYQGRAGDVACCGGGLCANLGRAQARYLAGGARLHAEGHMIDFQA